MITAALIAIISVLLGFATHQRRQHNQTHSHLQDVITRLNEVEQQLEAK